MNLNRINDDYFEWLFDLVCENRYSAKISYRKLLTRLHETEFVYHIPRDGNRAEDGIDLRWRFALHITPIGDAFDIVDELPGPCSVLEMLIGLAVRCEDIMDDPYVGNRTSQWFWDMITNLGLGGMRDDRYNQRLVDDIIQRFLDREYEANGVGGLFTIRDCDTDLRDVEIWYQLCWYLDSIT